VLILVQEYVVYTSVQDSAVLVPPGYNSNVGVSVWGHSGKLMVSYLIFIFKTQ